VAANEVFAILPQALAGKLRDNGAVFYDWHAPNDGSLQPDELMIRLVTSYATTPDEVGEFARLLG
jgi:threonine aldolase